MPLKLNQTAYLTCLICLMLNAFSLFGKNDGLARNGQQKAIDTTTNHINFLLSQLKHFEQDVAGNVQINSLTKQLAETQFELGQIYHEKKDTFALKYQLLALKNYRQLKGQMEIARALCDLGKSYLRRNQNSKAIDTFKESLEINELLSDSTQIEKGAYWLGYAIFYNRGSNYLTALDYFERGINISRKLKKNSSLPNRLEQLGFSKPESATLFNFIGFIYSNNFKTASSLEFYEYSLSNYRNLAWSEHILNCLINIGRLHLTLGDYSNALDYFQQCLQLSKELDFKTYQSYSLNNIGLVYQELKYYEKAIEYLEEGLKVRKELDQPLQIAYSYFDIGKYYSVINEPDQALVHYIKSMEVCRSIDDTDFIPQPLIGIANYYIDENNFSKSEKYIEEIRRLGPSLIGYYNIMTKFFLLKNAPAKALPFALKAYNTANEAKNLENEYKAALYLQQIFTSLGDYKKALEYAQISKKKNDGLQSVENTQDTRRLIFEFETEKKEAEVVRLEQAQQLQLSQFETQQYLLYLVIILGLLMASFAVTFYLLNKKNQLISEKNSQLVEQESELRTKAMNLFANISHEFRTPLTILRAPLEAIVKRNSEPNSPLANNQENYSNHFKLMLQNTYRLTELVNQMLDLAKMKDNHYQIHKEYGDPIHFLRTFVGQFGSYAHSKNLALILKVPTVSLFIHYDEEILNKILSNLLINALKFTKKGTIQINFNYFEKHMELKVDDTGQGISSKELPFIFEKYYSNLIRQDQTAANGLGLTLVKELVALYDGEIDVKSEEGKGTTFILKLPHPENFKTKELPQEQEKLSLHLLDNISKITSNILIPPASTDFGFAPSDEKNNSIKKILIIEDNPDLNGLLCQYLSNYYQVYPAFDGIEGLEMAQKIIPDLIVTDIMMPKMDGLSMAKKLHHSPETSHIPLIVISALKGKEWNDQVWKTGVVDFISKPLDFDLLLSKVKNLMDSRERFKTLIQKGSLIIISEDEPIVDKDKIFLEKLQLVLKENMDENIDGEKLSKLMLMSRTKLYGKIKSLTGMTSGRFINKIKMQYAFDLLKYNKVNSVSEAAHKVGFSNISFFSRKFKEVHGFTATDILNQKEKQ